MGGKAKRKVKKGKRSGRSRRTPKKPVADPTEAAPAWVGKLAGWNDLFYVEGYAEGYKQAADLLVDALADCNVRLHEADRLFCPVAYLYRHHIELMLKSVLKHPWSRRKIALSQRFLKKATHDLEGLWGKVKDLASGNVPPGTERTILWFHAIDPNGEALRYAKSLKGKLNLEGAPEAVSLVDLKKRVDDAYTFLYGMLCDFQSALEADMEMAADFLGGVCDC